MPLRTPEKKGVEEGAENAQRCFELRLDEPLFAFESPCDRVEFWPLAVAPPWRLWLLRWFAFSVYWLWPCGLLLGIDFS